MSEATVLSRISQLRTLLFNDDCGQMMVVGYIIVRILDQHKVTTKHVSFEIVPTAAMIGNIDIYGEVRT